MLYAYTSICLHMLLTVVGGGDCMEGGTTTGKGRHATQVELRLGFDTSHTFLTHFLRPQAYLTDRPIMTSPARHPRKTTLAARR